MTTIAIIDAEKALELLRAVCDRQGADYLYPIANTAVFVTSCHYVRDGAPSCIVGQALADHGVPIEGLASWDRLSDGAIDTIAPSFVTPNALAIFTVAQRLQDTGSSWGMAVERAAEFERS